MERAVYVFGERSGSREVKLAGCGDIVDGITWFRTYILASFVVRIELQAFFQPHH
jgi:hypothetical protein